MKDLLCPINLGMENSILKKSKFENDKNVVLLNNPDGGNLISLHPPPAKKKI